MNRDMRNSYVCSPVAIKTQQYDLYPSLTNLKIKKYREPVLNDGEVADIAKEIVDHFKLGIHENEDYEITRGSFFVLAHHRTEWETVPGGYTYMGRAEPCEECTRDEIEIVEVYNEKTERLYPELAGRIRKAVEKLRSNQSH